MPTNYRNSQYDRCNSRTTSQHVSPVKRREEWYERKKSSDFTPENMQRMVRLRKRMDEQMLLWALFSFNNVQNGSQGGVYELLERDEVSGKFESLRTFENLANITNIGYAVVGLHPKL